MKLSICDWIFVTIMAGLFIVGIACSIVECTRVG